MGKWAPDAFFDAGLAVIQACNKITVCSAAPGTYTEANSTFMLANTTMTPTTDFPISDDTLRTGRKISVAAKSGVSITNEGDATHVALLLTGVTELRLTTTCNTQHLSSGAAIDLPSFGYTIADPI